MVTPERRGPRCCAAPSPRAPWCTDVAFVEIDAKTGMARLQRIVKSMSLRHRSQRTMRLNTGSSRRLHTAPFFVARMRIGAWVGELDAVPTRLEAGLSTHTVNSVRKANPHFCLVAYKCRREDMMRHPAKLIAATAGWRDFWQRRTAFVGGSAGAWLAISGIATVAAIFIASFLLINHFRERALLNSERELSDAASMLARHFDQQIADSSIIAADLMNRLGIQAISSPESFRTEMSKPGARLAIRSQGISYLGDISLFDTDGDMLTWSRDESVPELNIAVIRLAILTP
jgi:hypothetical protein